MKPLWTPSSKRVQQSNVAAFTQYVLEIQNPPRLSSFQDLYHWSVNHPKQFWLSVWLFCGIKADREPDVVVSDFVNMPGARWFPGVRLNFAENLLRYRDDHQALVFWNERGRQRALTYEELHNHVARFAAALRNAGVEQGDRVAGYMPNMPETVVAMLATTSIGALWSSCSPDFGLSDVRDRFGQIEPKILITADGYFYHGKTFDSLQRVSQLRRAGFLD